MNNAASHKTAYEQIKFLKHIWDFEKPVVLYDNKRKGVVNFVFAISLAISILCTYNVLSMSRETLITEFSTLFIGRLWQIFFIICGNILLFFILRYKNRYIIHIELKPYKQVVIKTWNLGRGKTTTHDPLEFKNTDFYLGQTVLPNTPIVQAPYFKLSLNNGKTYLLDMQGDFPMGYPAIHKVFNP